MIDLPESFKTFLDGVEESDLFKNADVMWMNLGLGEATERYGVTDLQFALFLMDIGNQLRSIVVNSEESDLDQAHGTEEPCQIGMRLAEFVAQLAVLAALATREERGRPPIWQGRQL